jgi:flavin reductase (DIM6/NTAB) family NADH-FMN oxidoreductase RutF
MTLLTEREAEHWTSPRMGPPIDQDVFRGVMGAVCTPVAVVSALDGARPHAATVSSFASQSMSPPMVLVSLASTSRLLTLMTPGVRFGLNVLGADQSDLALRFAGKGEDKFADVAWTVRDGAPALPGCSAWLSAEVSDLFVSGDHVIVCGTVVAAMTGQRAPLTYHARSFGTHAPSATCA